VPKDPRSDLYALPLDEFTAARNELAKELAAGGDKAAATEVRALKKPSVPAWAVNQVARAHPKDVEALCDVQKKLRDAQKKLIRSGDQDAVREATTAERQAVRRLVDRAREVLAGAGHTANEATLERVADTFYATAVDEGGLDDVKNGTLTKELKRVGFGDIGGLSVVPAAPAAQDKPKKKSDQLLKEAVKLQTDAEEAEERAQRAEADAAGLAKEADDARARADAAREQARFARREASEARRDADKAARRADRKG
jgi:hypothetical protein